MQDLIGFLLLFYGIVTVVAFCCLPALQIEWDVELDVALAGVIFWPLIVTILIVRGSIKIIRRVVK